MAKEITSLYHIYIYDEKVFIYIDIYNNIMLKKCIICGNEFISKTKTMTCSIKCRETRHKNKKHITDKKWRDNNKEKVNENNHKRYKYNRELLKLDTPEAIIYIEKFKKYERIRSKRQSSKLKRVRTAVRISILNKLSDGDIKCKRCGFTDIRALQIDHINGGGNKDVKKYDNLYKYYKWLNSLSSIELKKEYQILCANCNWIKRWENGEMGRKSHGDEIQ
jgi:hypothetical protein